MSTKGENFKELNPNELENISGGLIVKVSKEDLEKEKIALKKYIVVDFDGKIVESFDNYEDAAKCEYSKNKDMYTLTLNEGELKDKVYKTLDGHFVFKMY